jgi:hypothetical protein
MKVTGWNVVRDFNDRWNYLHCLDAIGGKHVNIKCSGITTVETNISTTKILLV